MRKVPNEDLGRPDIESYKKTEKLPVVVVLDNVRSMHNVGSTFRTSDAFLIDTLYLTGITAQPPHRDIHKSALGATESVNWEYHENPADLIKNLKEQGYYIISVEQTEPATNLADLKLDTRKKYCFVFGNEVKGVMDEVIEQSDECLEIPQFGTKHSLNISVSVGVVLWEVLKKLHN